MEHYHIDRSEAVAFGDGNNDLEMLKAVGHGIAMGNGSDELKEIAEEVCGHVADEGIYYYCKEHGLIYRLIEMDSIKMRYFRGSL